MEQTAACAPSAPSSTASAAWMPLVSGRSFATGTTTRWMAGKLGYRTRTVAVASAPNSRRRRFSQMNRSAPWFMASAILPGMCTRTWSRVSGRWTRGRSPSASCTPTSAATPTTRCTPPAPWMIWRSRGSTTGLWAMFTLARSWANVPRRWFIRAIPRADTPTRPVPGAYTSWKSMPTATRGLNFDPRTRCVGNG